MPLSVNHPVDIEWHCKYTHPTLSMTLLLFGKEQWNGLEGKDPCHICPSSEDAFLRQLPMYVQLSILILGQN